MHIQVLFKQLQKLSKKQKLASDVSSNVQQYFVESYL